MEIIKHGDTAQIAECPNCHCKFYYNGKDVEHECSNAFVVYIEWDYIECPECGDHITIKEVYV